MKKLDPQLKKLIISTLLEICYRDIKRGLPRTTVLGSMSRFQDDIFHEIANKL